jgi:hypothetical protein
MPQRNNTWPTSLVWPLTIHLKLAAYRVAAIIMLDSYDDWRFLPRPVWRFHYEQMFPLSHARKTRLFRVVSLLTQPSRSTRGPCLCSRRPALYLMAPVFHHLQICVVGKWRRYRTDSRPRAVMTLYTPPVGENQHGF